MKRSFRLRSNSWEVSWSSSPSRVVFQSPAAGTPLSGQAAKGNKPSWRFQALFKPRLPSSIIPSHSEAPMLLGWGLVLWGVPVLTSSALQPGAPSPAPRCWAGWGSPAWAAAGKGSFPVHARSYGAPTARQSPGGPSAPPRELRAP